MSKPPGTSGTKVDTALVLRNGYANEREILLGAGSVALKAPRVNDKRMGRRRQPPELFRA